MAMGAMLGRLIVDSGVGYRGADRVLGMFNANRYSKGCQESWNFRKDEERRRDEGLRNEGICSGKRVRQLRKMVAAIPVLRGVEDGCDR